MNLEQASPTPRINAALDALSPRQRMRYALARLTTTTDAIWPTVLRITLGGVMLPHALQKTLGLFGGFGLSSTMHWFTAQLHMPAIVAASAIFLEQIGALSLIFGLFTRAGAVAIGIIMVGAVLTVHLPYGFFMNWAGTQAGEGFEFHLLALAVVVALTIAGGGRASIDAALSRSRELS